MWVFFLLNYWISLALSSDLGYSKLRKRPADSGFSALTMSCCSFDYLACQKISWSVTSKFHGSWLKSNFLEWRRLSSKAFITEIYDDRIQRQFAECRFSYVGSCCLCLNVITPALKTKFSKELCPLYEDSERKLKEKLTDCKSITWKYSLNA